MIFERTFHPDEANQAFTTGKLLATGAYTYRPSDHHGPTLYYAAAGLQRAYNHNCTAELDGTLLRCTPLIFGVFTLLFGFLGLKRLTGRLTASFLFVLLLATAPIFVFYSTYFIQEVLLAAFTMMMFFASCSLAVPRGRLKSGSWALLGGIAAGLAFATKETAAITFLAMLLTLGAYLIVWCFDKSKAPLPRHKQAVNNFIFFTIAFLLTAGTLFSSFGTNYQGVYAAFVSAPAAYLGRAAGNASASAGANWHIHPWWQYLEWLGWGKGGAFPCGRTTVIFLMLVILPAALTRAFKRGCTHAFPRLEKAFWLAFTYTIFTFAIYFALPYKTPWCAVQMIVPLMLCAALGYTLVFELLRSVINNSTKNKKNFLGAFGAFAGVGALVFITIASEHRPGLITIFNNPDSPKIPYNYAHASPEVKLLAEVINERMQALKAKRDNGETSDTFIAVALPASDTWPLPWYNRAWESVTGYWENFEALQELQKSGAKPAVVIVPMSQGHLVQPLFPHLKNTRRFYMRRGVRVRVFW